MKKILYVYGYGGSHRSSSPQKLRKILSTEEFLVLCIDYPQEDCAKALEFLQQYVADEQIDAVMGSSLGAFLALCLDIEVPKIIVNPCLVPTVELPKLQPLPGKPRPSAAMVQSYASFEKQAFDHVSPLTTCFMAEDDELLGTQYRPAMQAHMPLVGIPGGHRITDEAMDIIAEHIKHMASNGTM